MYKFIEGRQTLNRHYTSLISQALNSAGGACKGEDGSGLVYETPAHAKVAVSGALNRTLAPMLSTGPDASIINNFRPRKKNETRWPTVPGDLMQSPGMDADNANADMSRHVFAPRTLAYRALLLTCAQYLVQPATPNLLQLLEERRIVRLPVLEPDVLLTSKRASNPL